MQVAHDVNVLVVDDEPSMRALLEVVLGVEKGVGRVLVTKDGTQALEACSRFTPDVVITDSLLPGMSGEEVAEGIRRVHPAVKVISFTGLDDETSWADASVSKGGLNAVDQLRRLVLEEPGRATS